MCHALYNYIFQQFAEDNIDDDVIDEEQQVRNTRVKKVLSNAERRMLYEALLERSVNGKLKKGVKRMVASQFGVSMRTVRRIWKKADNKGIYADVSHNMSKNCGRKRIEIDFARVPEIPLHKRTTIRSFACTLNTSKSTLFRRLKSGVIRRHTNPIKPSLNDGNKKARLRFCISMLDSATIPHDPTFLGMYNIIHIDEKWFYMTKKCGNYYLWREEEDPIRTCKSKNFIGKVMFLAAIARPRFDANGNELFSGKIGVFPLVTKEPAKRNSVNRPAGTLETKPITSVTKEIIKTYLLNKVIPAIKSKWPREEMGYPIFIQQDNARTHISYDDEEFRRVASEDGFDIRLMCQPPNSPDLNVLDLGFFNAIQSLQHQESPKSIDELVNAVEKSFETFPTKTSDYIFLTLQSCMIEIMKVRGSHKYKIPHMKKLTLEREAKLPKQLKCDPKLVKDVLHDLN